jgi:hypothetical protein
MDQHNSNSSNMNDDGNVDQVKNDSNSNDDDDCNLSNQLSDMNIDNSNSTTKSNSKSSKKKKDTCLHCLKEVEGCSRCSKCRTALYCNRECHEKHWPEHKNNCQDSNDTENSDKKLETKAENHLYQGKCMYFTRDLSLLI